MRLFLFLPAILVPACDTVLILFQLLILFMGFSGQECWIGLPLPSQVDYVLPELTTMTCLSWVGLHSMAHSFTELDKVVIHVINLFSFLWLWFFILSDLWWMRIRGLWKLPDGRNWLDPFAGSSAWEICCGPWNFCNSVRTSLVQLFCGLWVTCSKALQWS